MNRLLSASAVCELLAISPRTLRRLRQRGLRAHRLGLNGSLRFSQTEVERFLARHAEHPESTTPTPTPSPDA